MQHDIQRHTTRRNMAKNDAQITASNGPGSLHVLDLLDHHGARPHHAGAIGDEGDANGDNHGGQGRWQAP